MPTARVALGPKRLRILAIAWLTVGYQAVKAALADPVETLRYE